MYVLTFLFPKNYLANVLWYDTLDPKQPVYCAKDQVVITVEYSRAKLNEE